MVRTKKGAVEFGTGPLVVLLIAILVLAVVIIGFIFGWDNIMGNLTNWAGKDTVGSVVQGCTVACSSANQYDFCSSQRDVVVKRDDKTYKGKANCTWLANHADDATFAVDGKPSEKKTATDLGINVAKCPEVPC